MYSIFNKELYIYGKMTRESGKQLQVSNSSEKGQLVKLVMYTPWCLVQVGRVSSCLEINCCPQWQKAQERHLYKFLSCFQANEKGQESFLLSAFLNCFQLKIIHVPKWHIWADIICYPSKLNYQSRDKLRAESEQGKQMLYCYLYKGNKCIKIVFKYKEQLP